MRSRLRAFDASLSAIRATGWNVLPANRQARQSS
jgi:hypothetical protein